MKRYQVTGLLAALFIVAASCVSTGLKEAVPEEEQVSSDRLGRIDSLLNQSVQKGWIRGAVGFIARDGKIIYNKGFGLARQTPAMPMETDAIFRIASQTKAITSVATMILFEEGKLLLDDPVSKYIPEFAVPVVLNTFRPDDTTYTVVPAQREITIRHLLTHTSGIDYAGIGSSTMNAVYAKAGIPVGFESRPLILGEWIKKLAKLPLIHQPGERFTYGLNTDVLGYLVEVVSGKPLDRFMAERIFEPLGMHDTYFYLPEAKHSRLVEVFTEKDGQSAIWPDDGSMRVDRDYPLAQGTYFSGGAGLSSTVLDYGIFLQMLLNGGTYKGNRILSRRTVEMMTSNQIGDIEFGAERFGLGFSLGTAESQARLGVTAGSFSWGGFWGTTYWADPEEGLVCQLYTQQWPQSHGEISDKFRVLVYAALSD